MNDEVRKKLKEIVIRHGYEIIRNEAKCEALLKDHCWEHKKEINVLIMVIKTGIVLRLAETIGSTKNDDDFNLVIEQMVANFIDETTMSEEASRWGINSWTEAFKEVSCQIDLSHGPEKTKFNLKTDESMKHTAGGLYTMNQYSQAVEHGQGINDFRYFNNDYFIKRQLEVGGKSDVYLVGKNENEFALKIYRLKNSRDVETLRKFKEISDAYRDNFIKIFETGYNDSLKLNYEITEFIKHGSLKNYMDNNKDLNFIRTVIEQINNSLNIIHDSNLEVSNLKPANVMIRSEEPLSIVLADFGVSSRINVDVTPIYVSPEMAAGVTHKNNDYWSLGIIILELLGFRNIFKEVASHLILSTLCNEGVLIPENIDENYKLLLKGLLTRNPQNRWGYKEVSDWLSGKIDMKTFYNEEIESLRKYNIPFNHRNKSYYSLEALVSGFIENKDSWEDAKKYIDGPTIILWLGKNYKDEEGIVFDDIIKSAAGNKDLALFRVIYHYNDKLPMVLYGNVINIENLCLYLSKYLKKECEPVEEKIIIDLLEGKLQEYAIEYARTLKFEYEVVTALECVKPLVSNFKENDKKIEIYYGSSGLSVPNI